MRMTIAWLLLSVSAMPALAQNRFMDQAREAAERRAEHKAVREAENPEPKKATATAQNAPAETPVVPAETPVAPAAQAAPATPAPAQ